MKNAARELKRLGVTMKKLLSASLVFAICFLFLCLPGVKAQITITSSDINKPVGYVFAEESTDIGTFTVDLGQSGGPRTWDFTSYETPFVTSTEVVNVAGTPFAGNFPGANMCFMLTEEGEFGTVYTYMDLQSNMWTWLGNGIDFAESSLVQVYDPQAEIPLPINMGSSWTFELGWADTVLGFPISFVERSHVTVDAWGTMTIPMGTFDVLRWIAYDTTITTTGIPPFEFADTSATIEYTWAGKEQLFVVDVSSMEGETNPNFTQASSISRAAPGVGIGGGDEPERLPLAFELDQNYPNPFNPQTEITFQVSESARGLIELDVYSLRGSRVKTLLSGSLAPGHYTVSWDGKNDRGEPLPSGVYFYRLTADGRSITKKMILAR